jgi:hypothetical protein
MAVPPREIPTWCTRLGVPKKSRSLGAGGVPVGSSGPASYWVYDHHDDEQVVLAPPPPDIRHVRAPLRVVRIAEESRETEQADFPGRARPGRHVPQVGRTAELLRLVHALDDGDPVVPDPPGVDYDEDGEGYQPQSPGDPG